MKAPQVVQPRTHVRVLTRLIISAAQNRKMRVARMFSYGKKGFEGPSTSLQHGTQQTVSACSFLRQSAVQTQGAGRTIVSP